MVFGRFCSWLRLLRRLWPFRRRVPRVVIIGDAENYVVVGDVRDFDNFDRTKPFSMTFWYKLRTPKRDCRP